MMNHNLTPVPMDATFTNAIITDPRGYDDETGKLFVGGLSWDTTHESLLKYFIQFGEIVDCVVMKNQQTEKSRGFGFVKFKEPNIVDEVLLKGPHWLDGRQVDPKKCNPRSLNKGGKSAENSRRKIFVGGLPPNCDEAQLKEVFRQFGPVEEATIMFDQEKNRSRGFGFLTFLNEAAQEKVCSAHFIHINGKQVEVKRAEPRQVKSIADTGAVLQGAQGMMGLASPGASGAIGIVQNMSTGSLSGSPQQLPSQVGAAMQQLPGGQFIAGPGIPAGVAMVYNPAAAFGGGYYLHDQNLQFHPALHALPGPGLLGVPSGMAFAAGTGDAVMQNKNMVPGAVQMNKGFVAAPECYQGMQAVSVSGAETASGPGAPMQFQQRVNCAYPGVLPGNFAPAYVNEQAQMQAAGDAPGGPQYMQQIPPSIGRIPTNHTSSIFSHFHPYRR